MSFLGQHFLRNKNVIQRILTALDIKEGETIIEIGPGHGELTIPLVEKAKQSGARVVAIEKDKRLAETLSRNLGDQALIVSEDALIFFESRSTNFNESMHGSPYKLVGNLPYYLTGHLLRRIGELDPKPKLCIFMLQKEVAERIVAEPPRMNRLAASLQFWTEPKIIAQVPKADFSPPPKVDSAVVQLTVKRTPMPPELYYPTMHLLFAQPRKTILNNLAGKVDSSNNKASIVSDLSKIGVNPQSRPQDLAIKDIVAIATAFYGYGVDKLK